MANTTIRLSHYWTDPTNGLTYQPGQLASVEEQLAWRTVNGGLATYPADPSPGDGTTTPAPVIDPQHVAGVVADLRQRIAAIETGNIGY